MLLFSGLHCVVPSVSLSSLACALFSVAARTQALIPYLSGHFAIALARAQAISPCFHPLFRLFFYVWWIFADLVRQWRQIRGGGSEVGRNNFSILLFVLCVAFLFFLCISLARGRPKTAHA